MGYVFDLGSVLSGQYLQWFIMGVGATLALTAAAWCLAMLMGIVLTLIRMIPFKPFDCWCRSSSGISACRRCYRASRGNG